MDQPIELLIDHLSSRGRGVANFLRPSGVNSSVEVLSALPGEVVSVTLGSKRRGVYKSILNEVKKTSSLRVLPRCAHVPECGGCVLQQMDYSAQLKLKESVITQTFSQFLKASNVVLHPIIPCQTPWEYRNKMEFSFSQNKAGDRFLGLIINGSKGRVFNLTECHLTSSWFARTVEAVRSWWIESGVEAYHMGSDSGSLRTLILREGKHTGEKMVILTVSGNPQYALSRVQLYAFVKMVCQTIPDTQPSIFLRIQQTAKGMATQFYEMHLHGSDHIKEQLDIKNGSETVSLKLKISPTSFFQPNTKQAEVLYSEALKMLKLSSESVVFDLYCGTATLSMALATCAKKVIGIELNPHAVFDADSNKLFNEITNLEVHCGDVGKTLDEMRKEATFKSPDAVVVDPPRAGLDSLALSHLVDLSPKKILYVSCNPKTQAENIAVLCDKGYQLLELQPLDQFPHTMHLENIALLEKI